MSEPTRIVIAPAKLTQRGREYTVTLGDEVLIESTLHPFYASARALLWRGVTGEFQMWGPMADGSTGCRMAGDIETAAGLTVRETEQDGPRVIAWKPFPAAAGGPQSAKRLWPVST